MIKIAVILSCDCFIC